MRDLPGRSARALGTAGGCKERIPVVPLGSAPVRPPAVRKVVSVTPTVAPPQHRLYFLPGPEGQTARSGAANRHEPRSATIICLVHAKEGAINMIRKIAVRLVAV